MFSKTLHYGRKEYIMEENIVIGSYGAKVVDTS